MTPGADGGSGTFDTVTHHRADGLRPLVIIGAGGFGREVLDLVEGDSTVAFLGFVDDGSPDLGLLERRGAPLLGPFARLEHIEAQYLIGVGNGATRRDIDELATTWGRVAASIIHPSAHWGGDSGAGPGLVVCANTSITTNVRMGRHVHVNINATIGHDCRIADYVTLNPGANISGNVTIGEAATIGTGAAVIQGVSIGAGATVGAGAAVVRDVEPGTTVVGVPARPLER